MIKWLMDIFKPVYKVYDKQGNEVPGVVSVDVKLGYITFADKYGMTRLPIDGFKVKKQ